MSYLKIRTVAREKDGKEVIGAFDVNFNNIKGVIVADDSGEWHNLYLSKKEIEVTSTREAPKTLADCLSALKELVG